MVQLSKKRTGTGVVSLPVFWYFFRGIMFGVFGELIHKVILLSLKLR